MAAAALHVTLAGLASRALDAVIVARIEEQASLALPLVAAAILVDASSNGAEGFSVVRTRTPAAPNAVTLPPPLLPKLDTVVVDSFELSREVETLEEVEELERLQGLYERQIHARLGRLLEERRGREKIAAPCIVYVIQDDVGRVLEVDLRGCATADDQRALLAGVIRAASPLPLPPAGLAMGSYLTLDLSAL